MHEAIHLQSFYLYLYVQNVVIFGNQQCSEFRDVITLTGLLMRVKACTLTEECDTANQPDH
jgi:hypothetical protein